MSDEADRADNEVQKFNEEAMRYRKKVGPTAVGYCLYCHNDLPHGMRWCDSVCRDEWEAQEAMRRW